MQLRSPVASKGLSRSAGRKRVLLVATVSALGRSPGGRGFKLEVQVDDGVGCDRGGQRAWRLTHSAYCSRCVGGEGGMEMHIHVRYMVHGSLMVKPLLTALLTRYFNTRYSVRKPQQRHCNRLLSKG